MYRTNSIHINMMCVAFIGFFIYFFWHKKGKKLFDNNFSFTIFVFLINSYVCQTCIKRSTPRGRLAIPKYWPYLPVVSVLSSLKIAFYVRSLDIKNVWYAMFFFLLFFNRLVNKAPTLRENAEESVVGMKWDTDVEAGSVRLLSIILCCLFFSVVPFSVLAF